MDFVEKYVGLDFFFFSLMKFFSCKEFVLKIFKIVGHDGVFLK